MKNADLEKLAKNILGDRIKLVMESLTDKRWKMDIQYDAMITEAKLVTAGTKQKRYLDVTVRIEYPYAIEVYEDELQRIKSHIGVSHRDTEAAIKWIDQIIESGRRIT